MAVYMIVEVKEVMDKEKYGEYIRRVPGIVKKFGGKYIIRGGKVNVVCGEWDPGRMIAVEFESMDRFQDWWNSKEYREVAPLREQSTRTNVIVVEGTAL